MALDTRIAQTTLENLIHDTILYALGQRLPSVSTIAALRAVASMGASSTSRSDDDLICVVAGTTTGFRWSTVSTAADNGTTVIQPTDVPSGQPGRWLAWVSQLRFSPTVGAASVTLDQLTSGPLRRVIVLDKGMSEDDINSLITGEVPAVVIVAVDDIPEDATLNVGHRWLSNYEFDVTVIAQNLRDGRQAAQGSQVPNDPDPGANTVDGFVKVLLAGTTLNAAFSGDQPIRDVQLGRGHNWVSKFGQRRIGRTRSYTFNVTEEFPAAPNDAAAADEIDAQANLTDLKQQPAYDPANYVVSGIAPTVGAALAQTLSAGAAIIAGSVVNYAGGSVTFAAYRDTYRDLLPNGTVTLVAVPASSLPPPVTAGALRVGFTTTNASIVVGDTPIAQTQAPFGPVNVIPL